MRLAFYAAWWGRDGRGVEAMVAEVAASGYDGIETFVPRDPRTRKALARAIERHGLTCIAHQFEADGDDHNYRKELRDNLHRAAELSPQLVNSHTGRDHWPPSRIDPLIEVAAEVKDVLGVPVLHETHRGRFPYSAAITATYLRRHPDLRLTADLSHWACVSESLLADQDEAVGEALTRTLHVHARVGSAQSAQVADPTSPAYRSELAAHVGWWRRVRDQHAAAGADVMTITCEIGPPPYMPVDAVTGEPVGDFRAQNMWLREHLRDALTSGDEDGSA